MELNTEANDQKEMKVTEEEVVSPAEDTEENGEEPVQETVQESGPGEEEAAQEEESADQSSGKLFGRKKDKKTEKLEARVAELEDARMRQLAEFENFRKRSDKEKSQMFEVGARSVIEKILPVIDNFERGLAAIPEEEKNTPFVDGIEMVYKQMLTAMEEIGVKPIEAFGTEFNPDFHNAVMMVDDEEKESGTVAEELQKGYLYHDTVVRHSMVKVVN